MIIVKDDIIKFYELQSRLSEISPNIGIVTTEREFKIRVKEILADLKKHNVRCDSLISRDDGRQVTIFIENRELTYICIESMQDLQGRHFCKYII